MQITDIKCYVLESTAEPSRFRWRTGLPIGSGARPGDPVYSAILKVETDEGIVGMSGSGWGLCNRGPGAQALERFDRHGSIV